MDDKGKAFHVGVNAHLLSLSRSYRSAGINWYIRNLLNHLPQVSPEVQYTVFVGDHQYSGAPGLQLSLSRWPTQRPPMRILWEQMAQPWIVRRSNLDLVHGMAFVAPLVSSRPSIVTVHDLSFLYYPSSFRILNRLYLRTFTRFSVQNAVRIIAVSESTKRDLVQRYHLPGAKINVVPNGVDKVFRRLPTSEVAEFRQRQELPEEFILFVGTLEPRKNVVRLIQAYAKLPHFRPPLLLVGGKGWMYDHVFSTVEAEGLGDEVRFVGYVPAEDLPHWYNAATLFVYPSLYEGFGLPPLEAMACGTPVVSSMASSLPEVIGEAGLLVEPDDVDELSGAMECVLTDAVRQEEMSRAGMERARSYTWSESARLTVDCYRQALAAGKGAVDV